MSQSTSWKHQMYLCWEDSWGWGQRAGGWCFQKTESVLHLRQQFPCRLLSCVDAGTEPGRSRRDQSGRVCQAATQLSDSQTVAGAFSYFQQVKGRWDAQDFKDSIPGAVWMAHLECGLDAVIAVGRQTSSESPGEILLYIEAVF